MKRILLLLTLITQFAFSQTNTKTTTAGKYKMNVPDLGAKKDSVVVWDGTTKLLKFRPVSQITGTTNLDQLVSPTGISVFSSTGTDIVLPLATATNAGLLAPGEKTKLAGIAAGATANQTDAYLLSRANHTGTQAIATVTGLQTALDGKEPTITAGTTSQYYRGDKTFQALDKTAVGLGNVDNTTDLLKPISTDTQTALNLKANLASPALTGIPTAPTAALGTNTTQIATTAFVTNANSGWSLTGNSETNPASNFIGTVDAKHLVFRTVNTERLKLFTSGNLVNRSFDGSLNDSGYAFDFYGANRFVGINGSPGTSGNDKDFILRIAPAFTTPGTVLDSGVSHSFNYSWIQSRSFSNYSQSRTLLLNPNSGGNGINAGNVGIGSDYSLYSKLEVSGVSAAPVGNGQNNTEAIVRLSANKTGAGTILDAGINNTNNYVWLQGRDRNNYGNFKALILNPNGGNVGIGASNPTGILDVASTTSGSLPFPRMTQSQRLAISSPATGTHVYQTDGTEGVYVKKSSAWVFAY